MKPLVGIVGHVLDATDGDSTMPHLVAARAYVKAVAKAGGQPIILPLSEPDVAAIDELLGQVSGVVLTGGADVDPAEYGAEVSPECGAVTPERDRVDIAVARRCIELNVPTLAICRGAQTLAVAAGCTLKQHIEEHMNLDLYNQPVHDIEIEPGTRLAGVLGTRYWTNSLHHQCIAQLGEGTRIVARAPDGTPEAIEIDHAPNVLGVQWHPELIRHDAGHLRLHEHLLAGTGPGA